MEQKLPVLSKTYVYFCLGYRKFHFDKGFFNRGPVSISFVPGSLGDVISE